VSGLRDTAQSFSRSDPAACARLSQPLAIVRHNLIPRKRLPVPEKTCTGNAWSTLLYPPWLAIKSERAAGPRHQHIDHISTQRRFREHDRRYEAVEAVRTRPWCNPHMSEQRMEALRMRTLLPAARRHIASAGAKLQALTAFDPKGSGCRSLMRETRTPPAASKASDAGLLWLHVIRIARIATSPASSGSAFR
jgi:hypothetical protein